MQCPTCKHTESRVLESRSAEAGQSIRRRRECLRCSHRFTTYERIEPVPLMVTKRNGGRELFNSDKLMSSLAIAFEKVPIEEAVLTSLAEEIESGLQGRSNRDVSSLEIGQLVLEHLKNLNQVAYIRFASVYHQSQTLQDVIDILDGLQASERTDNGAANPSYPSPQTEADASNRSPASIPS